MIEDPKASVTPRNATPFHSIFLALTRSIPKEFVKNYIPYLISFQHSNHLVQRLTAAQPDRSSTVYKNAGLLTPKEMSEKDSKGDLFIKEAWKECVERCEGRVIYVKCCDSVDLGIESAERGADFTSLFKQNGAMVDLCADPIGWDSDEEDDENHDSPTIFMGQITNLKSILSAIKQAEQHIYETAKRKDHFHDEEVSHYQPHQPIPLIFDSSTPLLINHGVHKLTMFLTHLKQISNGRDSLMSPIFLPILSELLPPPSIRILEDYSDAVLTLKSGELSIVKRSGRSGGMISSSFSGGLRLTKEFQRFDIETNEKKGMGQSKLVLRKKVDRDGKNKRESNETKDIEDATTGTEKLNLTNRPSDSIPFQIKKNTKEKPLLKHEDDEAGQSRSTANASQTKPIPRIYMDDDDPEFDDIDEEDPDDDLDI